MPRYFDRYAKARPLGAQEGGAIPHGPPEGGPELDSPLGWALYGLAAGVPPEEVQSFLTTPETGEQPGVGGPLDDDLIQALILQMITNMAGGDGGASAAIMPYQAVVPPVLDILSEMRSRRTEKRTADMERLKTLTQLMATNLPANREFYPGFDPGSLFDIALGIASGHGVKRAQQILPLEQRKVERRAVPIPKDVPEPPISAEMEEAQRLAKVISDALRMVEAGKVVSI